MMTVGDWIALGWFVVGAAMLNRAITVLNQARNIHHTNRQVAIHCQRALTLAKLGALDAANVEFTTALEKAKQ